MSQNGLPLGLTRPSTPPLQYCSNKAYIKQNYRITWPWLGSLAWVFWSSWLHMNCFAMCLLPCCCTICSGVHRLIRWQERSALFYWGGLGWTKALDRRLFDPSSSAILRMQFSMTLASLFKSIYGSIPKSDLYSWELANNEHNVTWVFNF